MTFLIPLLKNAFPKWRWKCTSRTSERRSQPNRFWFRTVAPRGRRSALSRRRTGRTSVGNTQQLRLSRRTSSERTSTKFTSFGTRKYFSLSLHPSSAAEIGFLLAVHRGPGQVGLAAARGPPRAPRAGRPEPPRFQKSNSRLAILCFSNQMWYNHLTSLAP